MKKFLLALLGVLTAFSLVACGGSSNSDESSSGANGTEASSDVGDSDSDTDSDTSSSDEEHVHLGVKTEAKSATCAEEGNIPYWTCDECGKIFADETCETEIAIEDTLIAKPAHVGVKTDAKKATCEEDGNTAYWTCDECGKIFADAACNVEITLENTVIEATGHSATKTDAKNPTCEEDGNTEYWTCGCGEIFADEACKNEITLADTVIEATGHSATKTDAKNPTCEEDGNIAYWTCDCGKIFADEACKNEITLADTVLEATGHSGVKTEAKNATCMSEGNIEYWTCGCGKIFSDEDCKNEITLADTVIKISGHNGVKTEANEATCEEDGNIAYWTCDCGKIFADEACENEITAEETVLAKLAHNGVKTEANEATCEEDGNIAYWTCDCGKIFADEACENEITLADTVIEATGHNYGDEGVCVCGASLADKNIWMRAGENCASVTYTEGLGWKATAAGNANYYLKINREVTAYGIEQGCTQMTITFSGAFDGADFGGNNPLNCRIWILPPKAADGGNDWGYSIISKMQTELTKNNDGTYSHTIDLTNTAYDFVNYDFTIYVDYKAANTGGVVGAIYIKDIAYGKVSEPTLPEKSAWMSPSDGCESIVYTENQGWKATASGNANYYLKINREVTAYYIGQGCTQMTITFSGAFDGADFGGNNPLNCRIWLLPPKAGSGSNDWEYPIIQKMQTELTKNDDGTYSHTIDLTNTAYDFVNYNFTIYVDYKAANTGGVVGAIYIKDIAYGKAPEPTLPEKSAWMNASDNCAGVVYTEGLGWKGTAASNANYYLKISREVVAYYIEQGCTQMTITFSGAFDGADFGGHNPLNCRIWLLPKNSAGSNDWNYLSQKMQTELTKNNDGTYSHTIDLTNTAYDFVNYDFTIYVDYKAANTGGVVGAIYIKDIAFSA